MSQTLRIYFLSQQKNITQQYLINPMNQSNISLFRIILVSDVCKTAKSFETYLPVDTFTRQISLNLALDDACSRGVNLAQAQLFYADYLNKVNVFLGVFPLAQEVKIGLDSTINNSIQINFKPAILPAGQMINQLVTQYDANKLNKKNKKVKERTIQQAIHSVRMWREYYDTSDPQTGRRLYTLDQAAQKVGIAKKTLDDYHNHLRIALQFDFNLERYCESKIGILRKFVKLAKEGGSQFLQRQMPEFIIQTKIEKYWTNFSEL